MKNLIGGIQHGPVQSMGVHGNIYPISPLPKTVRFLFGSVESAVEGTALFLIEGLPRKSLFSGYLQGWEEALDAKLCLLAGDSSSPL